MASSRLIKCRVLRCMVIVSVLIVLLMLGGYAVWYLCASRQNPKVVEIVGGSILVTLLIGSSSTLFAELRGEPKSHKGAVTLWFMTSVSFLAALTAFLVYCANTPKEFRRQIPVSYLIDMNELELASDLEIGFDEAALFYDDAVSLFRNLKRTSPDNENRIRDALADPGRRFHFGVGLFRDLTEILVPRCMRGVTVLSEGSEGASARGETRRWNGSPNKMIGDRLMDFNDIQGDLSQNQFFGLPGSVGFELPNSKLRLHLPKDTRVRLVRDDRVWSSTYIITNDFVEIKIGVYVFFEGIWLRLTYPADSAFRVSLEPGIKRRGPFYRVDAIIYYDVKFDKLRHSFSDMRYYEEWANDLFALLERRFAWGSPPLLEHTEVMRRYKQHLEQKK